MNEPTSALTNSAFIPAGVAILLAAGVYGAGLALSLFVLGAASYMFHAKGGIWQRYDEMAMYLTLAYAVFYASGILFGLPLWWFLWAPFPVAATLMSKWKTISSFTVIPMLVGMLLGFTAFVNFPVAIAGAVLVGASFWVRQYGEKHVITTKNKDRAHGIWHVGTALAIGLLAYLWPVVLA